LEPNGKWALLAVVVALVMTGCGSSRERSPTGHVSVATSKAQLENDPSKNASDSNTPRVGPIGSVEVDDLRWHLGYTPEIATYSLPLEAKILERAVANGIFIVVPLSVTDHKSESVRLTSELVSLVAGGKTYSMNRDAEAHLPGHMLSGEELGPNVGDVVEAVFDVAPEVLHERPELRFNELGFGTTHAYIELPPWHSGTGQIVAEALPRTQDFFQSPSGNIECELHLAVEGRSAAAADCQTMSPPESVTMTAQGALTTCSQPAGCVGNGPVGEATLGYGNSTQLGPFHCASNEITGITCTIASGKGFDISRSGMRPIGG
jgi:hypothetical protein